MGNCHDDMGGACDCLLAATGYEAVIPNDLAGRKQGENHRRRNGLQGESYASKPSNDHEMIWQNTPTNHLETEFWRDETFIVTIKDNQYLTPFWQNFL